MRAIRPFHLFVLLAVVAALPALAIASSGDTVAAPEKSPKQGPDCSEPLKGADGKPTDKYDPRCTEEMIRAAAERKKAAAAGYDMEKVEGLEGLGQKPEDAAGKKEYGTLEDLFGLGRLFDAGLAYPDVGKAPAPRDRG